MTGGVSGAGGRRTPYIFIGFAFVAFLVLVALGTWQVQRLYWKEALIAAIDERMAEPPAPIAVIEEIAAAAGDVDYRPVVVEGTFIHGAERHFFATHGGESGWYVYTPMTLADGRIVFVNRGFVPYDRKEPATRSAGQVEGTVRVEGLARSVPAAKPSFIVPDNQPDKNVFHWKDLAAMAASAGLPQGAEVLPLFVDSGPAPNPGGLPVGGVTIVQLPNNHLQYVITWYGLALALVVVSVAYLRRRDVRP